MVSLCKDGWNIAPSLVRVFVALLAAALIVLWTFAVAHGVAEPGPAAHVHSAALDTVDHGQVDGDPAESTGGHVFGHDSADHSHPLAFAITGAHTLPDGPARGWLTHPSSPIDAGAASGIDRPPKRAPIA